MHTTVDLQTTLTVVRCLMFGAGEALLSSLKLVFIYPVHVNREAFTWSVRVGVSLALSFALLYEDWKG